MKTTTIKSYLLHTDGWGGIEQSQTLALQPGSIVLGIGMDQHGVSYDVHVQEPLREIQELETHYLYFLKPGDEFNAEQCRYICSFDWEIERDPYGIDTEPQTQTYHFYDEIVK